MRHVRLHVCARLSLHVLSPSQNQRPSFLSSVHCTLPALSRFASELISCPLPPVSDRAFILMAVRQRLGLASSGSGLQGSIKEDRHASADLLAAVDCEERAAEKGGAAEGPPRRGAEEERNVSRSHCSPADAHGGGGSEADPSFPTGDEAHGREGQKGKPAVEKAMAESGDGRSGVGSGVRNQQIFRRCQERGWEGKRNAESRIGLLSQERPLGKSRSYVLGLMGGLFGVLAILWPFVRLGRWIPWLVGLMKTE